MNTTKTMRLPPRRVLTPSGSHKRKEREGLDALKPSPTTPKLPKPDTLLPGSDKAALEPGWSNQLLAGYLAHEYLTKGTLFGQECDPARAEAVAVSFVESKKGGKQEADPSKKSEPDEERHQRYVEVSNLLKADGGHLPGIVNPTQLARFLQM